MVFKFFPVNSFNINQIRNPLLSIETSSFSSHKVNNHSAIVVFAHLALKREQYSKPYLSNIFITFPIPFPLSVDVSIIFLDVILQCL